MARAREPGGWADRGKGTGANTRMDSWAWKTRVKRERANLVAHPELAVCWLCGEAIDMDLPPRHKRGFTLDHVIPLARGGDLMGETRPAHLSCNSSRGDGRKGKRKRSPSTLLDW